MMKRITSLFTMLLFFVVGAFAQEDFGLKTVSVGPALANFETDTWYFLHQSRGAGDGVHSVVGELPTAGGFAWDTQVQANESLSYKVYKYNYAELAEEELANTLRRFLIRFVESPNEEGAYLLQFANGRYWTAPNGNSSTVLATTDNIYDAWDFNVYLINGEEGHIGINQWNMQARLDNNGAGNSVVWWETGEIKSIDGNNDWAIHEVIWGETSAYQAAMDELISTLSAYDPYSESGAEAFVPGTLPGQYDPEAVAVFNQAIDAAYDAEDNPELTAEDLKALSQAIVDAYKAVLATRVYYTPASGYYFIASTLDWYEDVTIPAEEEGGEETTETIHTTKGIYANGNTLSWKTLDDTDCTFLWKLGPGSEENTFSLINVASEKGINTVQTSANVTFTDEPVDIMFDVEESDDSNEKEVGKYVIGIHRADQKSGTVFLHCGGHNGGAGKSGNIVGWNPGVGASRWVLEPVSDEAAAQLIADYQIFKDRDRLVSEYHRMITDATEKIEVAKDISVKLDEENPLVTDATQFSSPYTTTDQQCNEIAEVYPYLLDGNAATYWHSRWEDGAVATGLHYLQVEMPDVEVANAAIKMTRRNATNDHISVWGVYGLNEDDEEIGKDACELLGEVNTPWGSNTETVVSDVFPTKGYKYIRFYINNTYCPGIASRGYGHVSEFQLYPAEILQPTPNQYAVLGDIVKNLEALIAEQAGIEDDDLTVEHLNAMKAAYDAFIAKFVDPAPLRAKMAEVAPLAKGVKIGNNPGEWPSADCAATLQNTLAAAEAYDKAADYTPAKSEELLAALDAAAEGVPAAANKVSTSKWYYIHLATEADYDANGWGKANMQGSYNEETGVNHPELFGKYLTLATREDSEGGIYTILNIATEEVVQGNNLYFMDKEVDITEADQAKWRFIAVGDTAYMIQNKATGMYLRTAGTSGSAQLSVHPTLFNTKAIGYGQNIIMSQTLQGASNNNLHAQRDHNILVTWAAADAGSNSGMYIEEAENVAADYAGTDCRLMVTEGKIAACCYPVEISCAEKDVVLYHAALEGTAVTLQPLKDNKALAGQPFLLIYGSTEDYSEENEPEIMKFAHGNAPVQEPATVGALVGTFVETAIGAGKIVADGNALVLSKKSATKAAANSAYLAAAEDVDMEAEVTITLSSDIYDSIDTILNNATKNGNIYTLDGRMVGRGNLNAVKNLGRGIYILNGVKIAVK